LNINKGKQRGTFVKHHIHLSHYHGQAGFMEPIALSTSVKFQNGQRNSEHNIIIINPTCGSEAVFLWIICNHSDSVTVTCQIGRLLVLWEKRQKKTTYNDITLLFFHFYWCVSWRYKFCAHLLENVMWLPLCPVPVV
jgi:hypothetical protein